MDDWQCLSEYVREGSQSAFREVVTRHVDLVYATCRRVLPSRDAHLAEDATQAVFVILAKKARTIRRQTSLVGWLHNTARYVSCNALRVAANRRRHELEAAQMPRYKREAGEASNSVAEDLVDRALARLEAQERDAILLRFFEGRSFREVGVALNISEEAAKKRVWRGIEKLRQTLTHPGSATPAAATVAGLLATATLPAPATLAGAAASAALTGTGAAISLAKGAVIAMAISKTKATAAGVAMMILLLGGAAVVVKDIVDHPRSVSYTIPAAKPATQPAGDLAADTQPQVLHELVAANALLDGIKVGAEVQVAAPACSHLAKHPEKLNTAACTSCHTTPARQITALRFDRATPWKGTVGEGLVVLATQQLDRQDLLIGGRFTANVLVDLIDTNGLAAGTDAPAIEVRQLDGPKFSLADLKGKYVLLNFWDSTTPASLEQMPHLRAARKEWGNEPKLVIVGINVDEKTDGAVAFAKQQKMEWMQGYAGAGSKLMTDYQVGPGAAVSIGPDGKIVSGSLQGLAIDDALDRALRPR